MPTAISEVRQLQRVGENGMSVRIFGVLLSTETVSMNFIEQSVRSVLSC